METLTAKAAVKHGPYVFYNPATGDRFYDLKLGCKPMLSLRRVLPASPGTRSGIDLVTVKELLGHATINTTTRYAHSSQEAKARAVAKLPDVVEKVAD